MIKRIIPFSLRPAGIVRRMIERRTIGGVLVVGGPFADTRLGTKSYYSPVYSKLIGLYELELHPTVEAIVNLQPRHLIDIGAAEGYYVCGFARRLPDCKVTAFEADLCFRYYLRENLEANGIAGRVDVLGHCAPPDLQAQLCGHGGPTVVICDAEGAEHELLDPQTVPELRRAWVLVEMHDFYLSGLGEVVRRRFKSTHHITVIGSRPRTRRDFNVLRKSNWWRLLPTSTLEFYLKERPFAQEWLWMTPRAA